MVPGGRKPRQIVCPQLLVVHAETLQLLPRIQSRIVTVIEVQANCVVTDGLYSVDTNVFFANLQHLLTRSVPAHLGGRRMHTQKLRRKPATFIIAKGEIKHPRLPVVIDLGRNDLLDTHGKADALVSRLQNVLGQVVVDQQVANMLIDVGSIDADLLTGKIGRFE